jgi:hypothetical protein
LLIKEGVIAVETIILAGLVLLGLVLILILPSTKNTKIEWTRYEVRHIGEHDWHKISEKTVMERLVDSFEPVTPIISRMLKGEEIIVSQEIYRVINC